MASAAERVALNTAPPEQLEALPMLGPTRSALWLEWRSLRGPCASLDELRELPGFGSATVEALRPVATCGEAVPEAPPAPSPAAPRLLSPGVVDVNGASAEVLATLPGLPDPLAVEIVRYREQNGPFESCGDLVRVPGIGPATVAASASVCVAL